jgi:integrase
MSKAAKAVETKPNPGDRNPDNPKEVWALCTSESSCPWFPDGRWVEAHKPRVLEAAGYRQRCVICSQRARWQRPGEPHPARITENITYPSGSIALLKERTPDQIKRKVSDFLCGICSARHEASMSAGPNETAAFCSECLPWSHITLRAGQWRVKSAERDAVYANIKRVRKALERVRRELREGGSLPANGKMPFWTFTERWAEQYQQANKRSAWDSCVAHYRHLVLYFEGKPIGRIGAGDVDGLKRHLLRQPGLRGLRSEATVGRTLETLRRMLGYAVRQGWLKASPFTDAALVPRYVKLKSDRIVRVEEEDRLHAACVGEFTSLLEALIYLADTGAYDSQRLELTWTDVRFDDERIKSGGGLIEMTPRLSRAMRALWERAGQPTTGVVWSERRALRKLPQLCEVAGVERFQVGAFKRTFAWRMGVAGKDSWHIADMLGLRDPGFIRAYLDSNSEDARQELASQRFKAFIDEQLKGSINANGSGQKNGGAEKREVRQPRFNRDEFIEQLNRFILEAWSITKPKIPSRDFVAGRFALAGLKPTTGSGIKDRLSRCGVEDDWDVYARGVLVRLDLLAAKGY